MRGAEERLLLETKALHTYKNGGNKKEKEGKNVRKKLTFTNLKKGFEHIELPAKLPDYFLRSNRSNINHMNFC